MRIVWVYIGLVLSAACLADDIDDKIRELMVVSEQYPPLNYVENGEATGSAVETLQLIYRELGIEFPEVQFLPWTRGYHIAQSDLPVMLFTMSRTDAREDLFQWVGQTHSSSQSLVTYAGSGIEDYDPRTMQSESILAVRSDVSHAVLGEHDYPANKIDLVDNVNDQYRMLRDQRVKLASVSDTSFLAMTQDERYKDFEYEFLFVLRRSQGHFAFSNAVDPKVITRMQQALDSVRSEQKEILNKYGLTF